MCIQFKKNRMWFYKEMFRVATAIHKPDFYADVKSKLIFLIIAGKNRKKIERFYERILAQKVAVTSKMIGVIEWPYIHNEWDIDTKFDKLATHYELLSGSYPALTRLHNKETFEVISFNHISAGTGIIIDHAQWFIREGELVINLFRDDLRVASLAFTLGKIGNDIVAYIGAVQGIHSGIPKAESLEINKLLTRDFEGLRPRSLLLDVLKVVLEQFGVKKIFAISEQHRHHRHRYFGNNDKTVFKVDYNVFWEEHGGVLDAASGFYEIPTTILMKQMSEIPSKKRSMYKRRYEIIDYFKNNIHL